MFCLFFDHTNAQCSMLNGQKETFTAELRP
jgi:hypothetical protein